ncbi:MAG TPA: cytochrome bd-I ubiquinol oxidase subunit CydA, partial [Pseudomonas sp.]|nr:cytochrome bd-I ubiquinol oxidase subunit CydA [Pseudomonas sp.]
WSIAELLPTHLSASTLAVGDIWGSLVALVAFYTLLLVVEMFLMIRFARLGPSSLHTGRYHFELAPATPRHIRKPRDAGAVPAAAKDAPIEPTPV